MPHILDENEKIPITLLEISFFFSKALRRFYNLADALKAFNTRLTKKKKQLGECSNSINIFFKTGDGEEY